MPQVTLSRPSPVDGRFQILYSLDKGESLPVQYIMAANAGAADIPSAATLTVAATRGGPAIYTAACTITNGGTEYTVSATIPAATTAVWEGVYVFAVKENHATFDAAPAQGEIRVRQSVEVQP